MEKHRHCLLPLKESASITGGQGFEPRFCGPEPHVLPLDDPPVKELSVSADTIYSYKELF